MTIRSAIPEDAAGIAKLEKACFVHPWDQEGIEKDLRSNPRAHYYIAEQNYEIIGYISLYIVEDEGQINNIAVLPEQRKLGIGSQLMEYMINDSYAFDAEKWTLELRPSNTAAMALYTKFGFKEEGRRINYYTDPKEDALLMWKHEK